VVDEAGYEGNHAVLSPETMDEACRTYFLGPLPESVGRAGSL
jgi:hypothetical protein